MPAVRAHVDSDGPRKRRLKPSARRAARLKDARMNVTDINEGEPPDLALVRLLAVVAPALWTPPPVENENAPLPPPRRGQGKRSTTTDPDRHGRSSVRPQQRHPNHVRRR